VFGALDCDCADQLREAMKLIMTEGRGLVIHIHQEGRGQGLSKKIRAVGLMQRAQLDTVEAFEKLGLEQDIRRYDAAVQVLRNAGIDSVRLISNNPRKIRYLQQHGIQVEMVNTHPRIRAENAEYLKTKKAKLGHHLPLEYIDDPDSVINFYHSDQPWDEFTNFSQHAIYLHDQVWPTIEHFYQAQKFAGTDYEETIRTCPTPLLAKNRAKALAAEYSRPDWYRVRDDVMLTALRAKFTQHPDLRIRLLSTGTRKLVEHTGHDNYWADGGDGTGRNRLGELLMQVRTELRQDRSL
jgi:GTP cyclohydrolase II